MILVKKSPKDFQPLRIIIFILKNVPPNSQMLIMNSGQTVILLLANYKYVTSTTNYVYEINVGIYNESKQAD